MTAYDFSLIKNTSVAFNATVDSINLGSVAATAVSFSASGSNLVITIGSDTVTLQNTTLAQLTTSNAFLGSSTTRAAIFVGDNATGSVLDNSGNTINTGADTTNYTFANQQNANHLIFGFGGGDAITANGSGDQVIYGGTGVADSTDGNDTIAMGSGSNTLYANAGNDVVTFGTATLAGKTVTAYLGLGDDSFTSGAAGGSHVVYGNSGADTINQTGQTGDATLFGGNGIADSTDGNDVFTVGTGNVTVYGNSGNDSITTTGIAANKTQTIYAGTGNDTVTVVAPADASAKVTVYGNTGTDSITATNFTGDYTIFGGNGASDSTDGADTITAGVGNAVIYANSGNDVINVSGAMTAGKTAVVYTGSGNDTVNSTANTTDGLSVAFYSNAGDDVFNLNNGGGSQWNYTIADFASGDKVNVTLQGAGASVLTVSGGGSSLVVADANNSGYTFQGYSGNLNSTNFVISGGTVLATNFSTTATTLTGADGKADQLVSGAAGDTLVGGNTTAGNHDKLVGNAGDDVFQFSATAAADLDAGGTVTGGEGTDTLEITGTTAANLADTDFTAQITGVEKIKVANVASNVLALNTGAETAGVNYVDASALTTTNQINVTFGAGYDTASTVVGGTGADNITYSTQTGTFAVSLSGGAGGDVFTFEDAVFDSNDTIAGGNDTDRISITDAAGNGYTITDAMFTNVTGVEQVTLGNAGANSTATFGTLAQAAGVVTIDASAETGHTVNINASAYTTGVSITGGGGADTLTGGSGADTIHVNGLNDTLAIDVVSLGGGADTLQLEIAEAAGDGDNAANAFVVSDMVFGTDIIDFTDLAVASLRGTGNNIIVGNGTAANWGAATDSLYVATNTFAATEAGIQAGMTANDLADGAVVYLLFSNATDAYLARITGAGGVGITGAGDSIQFLAKFTGHTSLAAITEATFDASFADWVA